MNKLEKQIEDMDKTISTAGPFCVPVEIKDIDMPLFSMVRFMVKWAIASIPAMIILSVFGFFLFSFLAGMV